VDGGRSAKEMPARRKMTLVLIAICFALAIVAMAFVRYGYYLLFDESAYAYCLDEEYTEDGRVVISGPRPRFFSKSDPQQIGWWGNEWYFDFYRDQVRAFCKREGCDWPRYVRREFGAVFPEADTGKITPHSEKSRDGE
jgi:hypothetical protein